MGVVLLTGGAGPVGACGSGGVALTGSSPFLPRGSPSTVLVSCLLFSLAISSFSSDKGCSVGVATLGVATLGVATLGVGVVTLGVGVVCAFLLFISAADAICSDNDKGLSGSLVTLVRRGSGGY